MDQDVFGQMELKYGSAFAQGVADSLHGCEVREVRYHEMRRMTEVLFRYRERARAMISHYRVWRDSFEAERDEVEKLYKGYEGTFLQRQVQDAWKLYVMANKDYHEMYRMYIGQLERREGAYSSGDKTRAAA